MQKPESFEKFYMTKVALGEGCGCAERVIDVHEWGRKGGLVPSRDARVPGPRWSLRRMLRKYGLMARPSGT